MGSEIRVLIADDHPVFRKGLRQLIEEDSAMKVVADVGDGESALAQIEQLAPDVALLDVDMPRLDGVGVARALVEKRLRVEIVFLTMHKDEDLFNEAMAIGAKGYVLKDSAVTDVVQSIRAVAAGQHFISPQLSTFLVKRNARVDALTKQKPGLDSLTPTERRILKLIAANKTSREIAGELFISIRTVENHRANISAKLELHGAHALLKFALDNRMAL